MTNKHEPFVRLICLLCTPQHHGYLATCQLLFLPRSPVAWSCIRDPMKPTRRRGKSSVGYISWSGGSMDVYVRTRDGNPWNRGTCGSEGAEASNLCTQITLSFSALIVLISSVWLEYSNHTLCLNSSTALCAALIDSLSRLLLFLSRLTFFPRYLFIPAVFCALSSKQ